MPGHCAATRVFILSAFFSAAKNTPELVKFTFRRVTFFFGQTNKLLHYIIGWDLGFYIN